MSEVPLQGLTQAVASLDWGQREGNSLKRCKDLHTKNGSSRGQNLAVTVVYLLLLHHYSQAWSWVIHKSMSLKYEPASEPLHDCRICAEFARTRWGLEYARREARGGDGRAAGGLES